ncbi:lytic transglycosylase domain-containing protein [Desulforhopalus sp. IMCC35007]|uniref:lytic transglycosylase domain-containing protein n=1 Tax=Desulforhopalus sp. IMCC35007 TaxID=2569543 RepID=UPI0010AEB84F|nr:lytic transglycosylase domain-containing protein [Desulforhopalus sp. IMCC35007]TKB11796.1 lytic transglycosylase [Desulforhopalus sp. IMCC35007]
MAGTLLCICLTIAFLLAGIEHSVAGMYLCRDASGKVNFTNVPNSSNCTAYKLQKKQVDWSIQSSISNRSDRSRYDSEIRRIARRYRVDPPLIKAIIHVESDFNHKAISNQGAQGLMQLMPATARELRVANPFNPRENIDGGTRYFRQMLDSFGGDLVLSLAAYNAGPGLVSRTGGVPQITETRRYVSKVLKRYKVYKSLM